MGCSGLKWIVGCIIVLIVLQAENAYGAFIHVAIQVDHDPSSLLIWIFGILAWSLDRRLEMWAHACRFRRAAGDFQQGLHTSVICNAADDIRIGIVFCTANHQ